MKSFVVFSLIFASLFVIGVHCGSGDYHICSLPPDSGYVCSDGSTVGPSVKHYFGNLTSGYCEEFQYNGCGGNSNRFTDPAHCESVCAEQGDARPSVTDSPSIDVTPE